MQHKTVLSYFIMFMLSFSQLQTSAAAPGSISKQQAYRLLKDGSSQSVRALPSGDREILMAKLALDAGKPEQAIQILSSPGIKKNQLAALLRAEAYRIQSVAAAKRAGRYAHAVTRDIGRLEHAQLNIGLDKAEVRLQIFMAGHAQNHIIASAKRAKPIAVASAHTSVPDSVRSAIRAWRKDWESRNGDAYLSHYHPNFSAGKHDYASWSTYKRRVNSRKKYIKLKLSDLSVLRDHEQIAEGEAILVAFNQQYQSNNYASNSHKQLYLVRKDTASKWLILYEGEASQPYHRHTTESSWAINLGSFESSENATKMASDIKLSGSQQSFVSSVSANGKTVHRVRIGMYLSRSEAVHAMVRICPELDLTDCWLEQLKQ